jgi:hypothetical protein
MELFLLILSHGVLGAVAYFIGANDEKKRIERELIRVLEEHNKTLEK